MSPALTDLPQPNAPSSVHTGTVRNWRSVEEVPPGTDGSAAAILDDLAGHDPLKADRLRDALRRFPAVGSELAGFRLMALLGRGAFGRVYLAQQGDLAGRYVALKVSADLTGESRTLARLQHTNIVPVYSAHKADPFHAVCMPYLGPITLAGLIDRCRHRSTLPTTGRELVHTLNGLCDDTEVAAGLPSSRGHSQTSATGFVAEAGAEPVGLPDRQPAVLQLLSGLSYLDAVCWIGSRLTDALTHAHDRGVIHNDLKPANILLADDGQPMLLDFGVSDDLMLRAEVPNAPAGGTLPYMSPEQLASFHDKGWTPDPRSDVYALGLILYELLTGVYPFRLPSNGSAREVERMAAERQGGPPRLRHHNRTVSPGLEAIIRKALEPDPARRYQTAADFRDDLERHRAHRPLRFVRVPSVRERVRKWSRRNPWVRSNAAIATAAGVLVAGLATAVVGRQDRLARYEAATALRETDPDVQAARYLLVSRAPTAEMISSGVVRSRAALDRYGVLTDPEWDRRPAFAALSADEQTALRGQLAECCLLLARGTLLRGGTGSPEADRLQEAVRLNERAERLAGAAAPRSLWLQRADLKARLGDATGAAEATRRADETPVESSRDHYLLGRDAMAAGRSRDALPLLERAATLDPTQFWAYMSQGQCYEDVGGYTQARASYTTAIALWPDFPWGYYNRGLVALRQGDFPRAKADFDRVVRLEPQFADVYMNRALVSQNLKQYADGIADLDRAGELGASQTRVCFMRARLRELAGDAAGAKRDLDEGMRREPADEQGWVARGMARKTADPAAAVTDFQAALALNPRSLVAMQNLAHVFGRLGRNDDALKVLDRAVELFPDYVPSRAGRGVIAARLGKWAEAEADAREAVQRDGGPSNVYQAAGIYALLTRHDPKHKPEALRLLTAALRAGFGFQHLETDKELDPIRKDAEFEKVLAAARNLQQSTGK